ncbi:ionotropic receptor 21a-like [Panulirus ornatus]|uniref:ionotropic receptor 21a-like n=1 Tax=Panulirus ornatus TaxID=150431 RepID=UPI003A8AC05C
MERYDYSYPYTIVSFGFGLAKPQLKPQWQSLYYPLADGVWASTLATLLVMPGIMYMITTKYMWRRQGDYLRRDMQGQDTHGSNRGSRGIGAISQEIFGTFLGQNLSKSPPTGSSSRVLVAAWLVFAFIIGTVYRGNLTAALTLPKYPPRPETLEELLSYVDRVTAIPIGKDWQKQFRESGSSALRRLADIMYLGPSIVEGLQEATVKRQAHLDERLGVNHWIAEAFTRTDGSSPLYYGRESIIPGASAWPIPHDAPYKPQMDSIMMSVVEAGLYEKWTEDTLEDTQREGRAKQRVKERHNGREASVGTRPLGSSSSINALTIAHMQGPLMLLLLGLVISGLTFTTETLSVRCCH